MTIYTLFSLNYEGEISSNFTTVDKQKMIDHLIVWHTDKTNGIVDTFQHLDFVFLIDGVPEHPISDNIDEELKPKVKEVSDFIKEVKGILKRENKRTREIHFENQRKLEEERNRKKRIADMHKLKAHEDDEYKLYLKLKAKHEKREKEEKNKDKSFIKSQTGFSRIGGNNV